MDYAALAAEIALAAYRGLSDAEIAAALNASTVETVRDVPTADARGPLLGAPTLDWGRLVLRARAAPTGDPQIDGLTALCITVEDTLRLTHTLEAASVPGYWTQMQAALDQLVAAGVIAEDTRDALLMLRTTTISRAQQLGLGEVLPGHVQTARRLP